MVDLRQTAPDLVLHGGDLADGGASPAEIVDQIRDLGWSGVVGNADQMLFDSQTLTDAARKSPGLQALLSKIEEMAAATRELLGDGRLGWLRGLPLAHARDELALVHASPDTAWRAPSPEASNTSYSLLTGRLFACWPLTRTSIALTFGLSAIPLSPIQVA